ncbi:AAA family ATPase [Streptomyces sp. SID8374]|uniref:ATP-binding protein n=1 Tax=Streptomyces sp. SID8374 TaxID=2690354 RepID=UPI001371780F|nr:AAA family ATPase [Streptomyces sp. SID8374]MYX12445.1 AAA family ATPase [Streptomyces sp. SID8374]
MDAKHSDATPEPARFVLPGDPPERETAEGWSAWRLTRNDFLPAPVVDLKTYRTWSPLGRSLNDLHRRATHANLPMQDTPMSLAVSRLMHSRMLANSLNARPTTRPGIMVNGGGNQGKTETAAEAAAAFEDLWLSLSQRFDPKPLPGTRDIRCTVAYVQTPVKATPKSTCEAILEFFGNEVSRNPTLTRLVRRVRTSLRDHRTRVLILDDITRLKLHRIDDQDTLDLLRALMSMHVTLVLIGVGIPLSGLLREGRQDPKTKQWHFPPPTPELTWADEAATQTERRFDLVDLEPFRYGAPEEIADFLTHLAGLEDQLRLLKARPHMLTSGTMPEYIFRRTSGVVGYIERLIADGAALAMDNEVEELTEDLLDEVVIRVRDPKRDAEAGEEGTVPPQPARTEPKAGSRPRNTTFDDKGIPATSSSVV